MKILFVGVFSTPYSNNIPQVSELRKKQHEVIEFDYRKIAKDNRGAIARILEKPLLFLRKPFFPDFLRNAYFFDPARKKTSELLLETASREKPELIILSKIEELHPKIIDKLNKISRTYYYFMDPVDIMKWLNAKEYAKRATFASATFSDVTQEFKKAGANAKQIVQGIEKEQFTLCDNEHKVHEVIFAGTPDKKRRKYLNYLQRKGISLSLFGHGTKNGPIYNEHLMREYSKSKIILNFIRGTDKGFSVRVFEALGSGSLLLTEYCEDLELFFKKGEELDWFKTPQECYDKITFYLNNPKKREQIAKRGKKKAFEKFTWEKQIENILNFVSR